MPDGDTIAATHRAIRKLGERTGCHPMGGTVSDLVRKVAAGEPVEGMVYRDDGKGGKVVDVDVEVKP